MDYSERCQHPGLVGRFLFHERCISRVILRAEASWLYFGAAKVSSRPCFEGLSQADPMSARKFLSMLPLQDQGLFRKALNGAAFASDVLCHFNDTGSDLCKFRGERDSRKHRFWACPAFHAEKSELSADFLQLVDRLPACLTQTGWAIPLMVGMPCKSRCDVARQ